MLEKFLNYLKDVSLENEYREELESIFPDKAHLDSAQLEEIQSRFSSELSFGTGV